MNKKTIENTKFVGNVIFRRNKFVENVFWTSELLRSGKHVSFDRQNKEHFGKELIMINYRIPSLHICRYICYFAFHKM
jgi:hypothetical protein